MKRGRKEGGGGGSVFASVLLGPEHRPAVAQRLAAGPSLGVVLPMLDVQMQTSVTQPVFIPESAEHLWSVSHVAHTR